MTLNNTITNNNNLQEIITEKLNKKTTNLKEYKNK